MNKPTIIAIAAKKGGTGKTTTAVNLSAALVELGHRVVLIDMDSQGDASKHLGKQMNTGKQLLSALVASSPIVFDETESGIDLVEGGMELESLASASAQMMNPHGQLRKALNKTQLDHDFVIIDSPPDFGVCMSNALVAAHWVIIPMETAVLPMANLGQTIARVNEARELNEVMNILGILPTKVDIRTKVAQEILDVLQNKIYHIFEPVPRAVSISEAPGHGLPVTMTDTDGHGARAYRQLAHDILEMIDGQ